MASEKPTASWVLLQQVYKDELQRFGSSKPALQAAWRQLKAHPYRYLDGAGVCHENDLSDEFFLHAEFRPDEGSAVCPMIWASNQRRIPRWEAYAIEIKVGEASAVTTRPNADDRPAVRAGRTSDPKALAFLREEVARIVAAGDAPKRIADWARVLHRRLTLHAASEKRVGREVYILAENTIRNKKDEIGIPAKKLARN